MNKNKIKYQKGVSLLVLLLVLAYFIFITSFIGSLYPTLEFFYFVIAAVVFLHFYNIVKYNKYTINEIFAMDYIGKYYPAILRNKSKRDFVLRLVLCIFLIGLVLLPFLGVLIGLYRDNIVDISYWILFTQVILTIFLFLILQIKKWISNRNDDMAKK